MQLAAIVISVAALVVSLYAARRQLRTARQANSVLTLVDLFREHRGDRLAEARQFVHWEIDEYDLTLGFDGLPADKRLLVRDLAWFYDNLGALVAHNIVDVHPVSGYLGGAALTVWEKLEPLVYAERRKRPYVDRDPERWQAYFENLCVLIKHNPPAAARARDKLWLLGRVPRSIAGPNPPKGQRS